MTFGLTPQGFNKKRLPDIKAEEENALIAEFGEINVQPQSVFGQLIGVSAKAIADIWEELEDVYYSQYPSTAEGVALDYLVALNGITRLPAERTRVIGVATGFEGTSIPENALANQPTTGETFFVSENGIITKNNAVQATVSIDALAAQIYTASVNGFSFFYSLPKIEFDGLFGTGDSIVASINGEALAAVPFNTDSQTTINDLASALQAEASIASATARIGLVVTFDIDFVASNSIVATINGVALGAVPFNTDQATTIADLAAAIQADASVTTATVTDTREITIVPVDEGTFLVDSIVITGGATQPVPIDQRIDIVPESGFSVTVDYVNTSGGLAPNATRSVLQPATDLEITAGISSVINAGAEPISAIDNLDGTFQIIADDSSLPFVLNTAANMSVTSVSSPINFLADNFGVIPAPIGSLTEILTPIAGWQSLTNTTAGITGREIETDAELRLRRQNSVRIIGAATVEAIRARLLQEVAGVTQAFVFENRTMTEEDIEIVFSDDLVTGNDIVITVNGTPLSTVSFSVDHLTTMQLLEVELETVEGISTVTVGGTGNRTLTVEITQGYEITINSVQITGGSSQANVTISGGRFPKSFEAVVQGGSDEDIANKIWLTKPAGIQTFGNTSFAITDSQGDPQTINFSRPIPIYIWVDVDLTLYDEEEFPNNGVELVKQAILDYGNTLGIGNDVLFQGCFAKYLK